MQKKQQTKQNRKTYWIKPFFSNFTGLHSATLLEKDSIEWVFKWLLRNFSEQLFCGWLPLSMAMNRCTMSIILHEISYHMSQVSCLLTFYNLFVDIEVHLNEWRIWVHCVCSLVTQKQSLIWMWFFYSTKPFSVRFCLSFVLVWKDFLIFLVLLKWWPFRDIVLYCIHFVE